MIEASTGENPYKISKDNFDIMLDVPESRSDEVDKILRDNLEWKVRGDHYELEVKQMTLQHALRPKGVELHYYHMKQKREPKGLLFTFHGLGASQKIDASYLANTFAEKYSFEVAGLEQETHGINSKREDRCYIKDFNVLTFNGVSFMEKFLEDQKERLKDVPIFIWGMSMGGATVSAIMVDERFKKMTDRITGAIVNAPAIVPTDKPGWLLYQGLVLASSIAPKFLFGGGEQISVSHFEWNKEWFMNHPDSFHSGVKLAMGREIVKIGSFVKKNASKFKHPLLLFHGDKDNMCRYVDTCEFFKNVSSKVKSFVRLKNMLHGIMHDRCIVDVVDITAQWVHQRMGVEMEEGKKKKNEVEDEGESEEEEEEEEEEELNVEKRDEAESESEEEKDGESNGEES